MKVLITGGAGFLGSHIAEFFYSKDWEVLLVDNLTEYEFKRSGYTRKARLYNSIYLKRKYNILTKPHNLQ